MSGSPTSNWRPVESRRSSSEIVEQVMVRFYAGMKPGDRIGTEGELAKHFGVSRITIRDAIRELEARGVVDVRVGARGGIHVAEHAPHRLEDALAVQVHLMGITWDEMLEAQQALEPSAARLAAMRATPEDVSALAALIEESRAASSDPQRFSELAVQFHLGVAGAARNRVILASLSALRHAEAVEHSARTSKRRAERVVAAHEGILQAIADGDSDLAVARMTEHLLVVRRGGKSVGYACGLEVVA